MPPETDIGAWAEVSLKHRVADAEINYHFDYILAPLVKTSLNILLKQGDFSGSTEKDLDYLIKIAKKSSYFQEKKRNLADISLSLPDLSNLFILEVMTASTSDYFDSTLK